LVISLACCLGIGLYGYSGDGDIVSIEPSTFAFTILSSPPEFSESDEFISAVDSINNRLFFNVLDSSGNFVLLMYDIVMNYTKPFYGLGLSTYLGGPQILGFYPNKGNLGTIYSLSVQVQSTGPYIPIYAGILSLDVETGDINYVYNFTAELFNTWTVDCGTFDPVNGNMLISFLKTGWFDYTTPTAIMIINVLTGTVQDNVLQPYPTHIYPLSFIYDTSTMSYVGVFFDGTIPTNVVSFLANVEMHTYNMTKLYEFGEVSPLMMLTLDAANNIVYFEAAGEVGTTWTEALIGINLTTITVSSNATVTNTISKELAGLQFVNDEC